MIANNTVFVIGRRSKKDDIFAMGGYNIQVRVKGKKHDR